MAVTLLCERTLSSFVRVVGDRVMNENGKITYVRYDGRRDWRVL